MYVLCVVCVLICTPFVFIKGSHGVICSQASPYRLKHPTKDCHVEPESDGAHWAVGRATDLPLCPVG